MSLNQKSPISAFSVYKKQKVKVRVKHENSVKNKKNVIESPPQLITKISKTKTNPSKIKKAKNKEKRRRILRNNTEDQEPPLLVPIEPKNDKAGNKVKRKDKTSKKENHRGENSVPESLNQIDPSSEGLKLFKWLIAPLTPDKFFNKYWESKVLHIQRNMNTYYSHLLTTQRLDDIFREFPLYYTRNVDVVSYENNIKEIHNEEGRVIASALYDYYSNGCSIRVLNPQTYDSKIHLLIATLQEYFGTMVGTNVYLTPPRSQGFAPHYDDIEAFVVQLEGRKHWKIYKPVGSDILARDSSSNLKHEDIGEPFMEVTLNAGDLLYFPRGTIHEGRTDEDTHSLHITVSVYQHNSYADLLEHVLPQALKKAASEDLQFRKGLPLDYLKRLGHVNQKCNTKEREVVVKTIEKLMQNLVHYADIDYAADQMGRKFMHESMPPVLSKDEVIYTSKYDGDYMKDGKIFNRVEIEMDTEVRLIRYHCLRLTVEDEIPKIYYNTDNAKVYKGEEEQFLILDKKMIPCIEKLQNSYPQFTRVEDLPVDDCILKAQVVSDLWERGLLVTNGPLPQLCEDSEMQGEDESVSSMSE